jgi:DNA-binding PadR family transcriptional regulator
MRRKHEGGYDRRFNHPEDLADRHHGDHHHHNERGHHGRGGHRRGRRPFDYGELRLLTLSMIAEQPSHGYELMKAIEERMGGSYTPSPGVMYPTLTWLEDMGYAGVETAETGRKRYQATAEGRAFLALNRAGLEELTARMGAAEGGGPRGVPAPVLRAMENLKLALRLRMQRGIEPAAADNIAAALDAAAQAVERS